MLPREASRGRPIPLVIQNYYYYPQFFLPDGPHSHSDAAQALVAQGFAVAQINGVGDLLAHGKSEEEGARFVATVDAIVESLSSQGLIDPSRVGITGFSRGGYQAYFAITHPSRTRLAAIVAADSFNGSYSSYLYYGPIVPDFVRRSYEPSYGGSFWSKKHEWLERETTFNVDRVRTPAMFTVTGNGDIARRAPYIEETMSTIGAFVLNRKPIEYIYLPMAGHVLMRPRERLEVMQAIVDWMSFWLNDKEPADRALAQKWRAMKDAWDATSLER